MNYDEVIELLKNIDNVTSDHRVISIAYKALNALEELLNKENDKL